ncbi:MAG: hemin uptake protein HemP [Burkholderiaceae bacterium]
MTQNTPNTSRQTSAAPATATKASTPQPIPSEDVLRGQSAVEIEHNGQRYRLQTTRQGKLILTK